MPICTDAERRLSVSCSLMIKGAGLSLRVAVFEVLKATGK
jgi:hypothetical protein